MKLFNRLEKSRSLIPFSLSASLSLIGLALANTSHAATNLGGLTCEAIGLIFKAVGLVSALALLVFLWGLVKFIYHAGNDEKRKEGKKVMIWGIIALFVMVSVWGITGFIQESVFGARDAAGSYLPLGGANPCP